MLIAEAVQTTVLGLINHRPTLFDLAQLFEQVVLNKKGSTLSAFESAILRIRLHPNCTIG